MLIIKLKLYFISYDSSHPKGGQGLRVLHQYLLCRHNSMAPFGHGLIWRPQSEPHCGWQSVSVSTDKRRHMKGCILTTKQKLTVVRCRKVRVSASSHCRWQSGTGLCDKMKAPHSNRRMRSLPQTSNKMKGNGGRVI